MFQPQNLQLIQLGNRLMHEIYAIIIEVKLLHVVKESNVRYLLEVIMRKGEDSDIR